MTAPTGTGRPAPPLLVCDAVEKAYGDKAVLTGLSLAVSAHEVVCLIGPSGSGKSTLLRCIDLLERIDGGRILLAGEEITGRRVDGNAVRRRIGMVFQSFNLFPHLTVLDNITLGARKAQGIDREVAEASALALLARVDLADKARDYPDRLSGGQQQRAAIVRALMGDPDLLLLDEVTSALDPELVGEVLGVIRELAGQGTTMLIATHEMGFARDVANRVCFMDGGVVVEDGPPQQVLADPVHERTRQFLSRIIQARRL